MQTLAAQVAATILGCFDKHFAFFSEVTAGARDRFERADWQAVQQAGGERIHLYDQRVRETVTRLRATYAIAEPEPALWQRVKSCYGELLQQHLQPELAETFYNSVFCNMFDRNYYNNHNIFVESGADRARLVETHRGYMSFYPRDRGLHAAVAELLESFYFSVPFEDLPRDVDLIVEAFQRDSPLRRYADDSLRIDVLDTPFFRNKAAYLIGRAIHGDTCLPFVVPLMNRAHGALYADALLTTGDQLGVVFSFARAHFMVKTPVPAATVDFLQSVLPNKPLAELYMCLGFHKQAKNEFYREFLQHLSQSEDRFVAAPGIRGMVMSVFTLPSFPYVFKVIRDRFAPPKDTTRQAVQRKYLLVKTHDRIGRMADTLEFSDVAFPRHRFSESLLQELQAVAPSVLDLEDERVVIRHCYIERRMRPLNLFLEQASPEERRAAVADWGLAIKELMSVNIFPGDLLFKNFGVTRSGRIVFYDYDELCYLTECNFRPLPQPRYPEEEMAAEPGFHVAPEDVFPEEFVTFVTTDADTRRALQDCHPELLDYRYWRRRQDEVRAGAYGDVFPYPEGLRFAAPTTATPRTAAAR